MRIIKTKEECEVLASQERTFNDLVNELVKYTDDSEEKSLTYWGDTFYSNLKAAKIKFNVK